MLNHSFSACAFILFIYLLIYFKVEISSRISFALFDQRRSAVAQRAEATMAECSPTSCVRTRFLIGSQTMPGQRHSQPTPTSLGQGCMRV